MTTTTGSGARGRELGRAHPQGETHRSRVAFILAITILITLGLYLVPYGHKLAWPLVLLSTLAHEMGHGLTAILVGGHFDSMRMWNDASGVAQISGVPSRLSAGLVSAGGLVGPALIASLLFLCARGPRRSRLAVLLGGLALIVAMPLFVRGAFSLLFVGLAALALLAAGLLMRPGAVQVTVAFLAIQLALSVFSRGDYLFTPHARTSSGVMPSDVANMATALGGPYWFWGFACGVFSIVVLIGGSYLFLRGPRPRAPRRSLAI